MGEASLVPLPLSTNTVTVTSGFSAGAKLVNQPCVGSSPLLSVGPAYWAVPVFPPTRNPGILNHLSQGPSKPHSIACRIVVRLAGSTGTGRPFGSFEQSFTRLPCGPNSALARCG